MTPEQLQEFERLLTEYANAAFDCGTGWLRATTYYELETANDKARQAVIAFVKELVK